MRLYPQACHEVSCPPGRQWGHVGSSVLVRPGADVLLKPRGRPPPVSLGAFPRECRPPHLSLPHPPPPQQRISGSQLEQTWPSSCTPSPGFQRRRERPASASAGQLQSGLPFLPRFHQPLAHGALKQLLAHGALKQDGGAGLLVLSVGP